MTKASNLLLQCVVGYLAAMPCYRHLQMIAWCSIAWHGMAWQWQCCITYLSWAHLIVRLAMHQYHRPVSVQQANYMQGCYAGFRSSI